MVAYENSCFDMIYQNSSPYSIGFVWRYYHTGPLESSNKTKEDKFSLTNQSTVALWSKPLDEIN